MYIYAVEAFRFYARVGKISAEEYRKRIYDGAAENTEITELKNAQGINAVNEAKGALYDIEAVGRTLEILSKSGKDYIISAIEQIYFVLPGRRLSTYETGARVKGFALLCPASERTVYRWLKTAREIFAKERGLNIIRYMNAKSKF